MFLPSRIGEFVKYAGQLIIQFAFFFFVSVWLCTLFVSSRVCVCMCARVCMLFIRCLLISFTFLRFTSPLDDMRHLARSFLKHQRSFRSIHLPIYFCSFVRRFVGSGVLFREYIRVFFWSTFGISLRLVLPRSSSKNRILCRSEA